MAYGSLWDKWANFWTNGIPEWGCLGWSHSRVTHLLESTSITLIQRVTTLHSSACSVRSTPILDSITMGRQLFRVDLLSAVFSYFFMGFNKNWFLLLSFHLVVLILILVRVLTGGFRSTMPIFSVVMPIWTSWQWLDRIIMFWLVLSLKSPVAVLSQSSVSLGLIAVLSQSSVLLGLVTVLSQSSVSLGLVTVSRGWRNPHPMTMNGITLYVLGGFRSVRESK